MHQKIIYIQAQIGFTAVVFTVCFWHSQTWWMFVKIHMRPLHWCLCKANRRLPMLWYFDRFIKYITHHCGISMQWNDVPRTLLIDLINLVSFSSSIYNFLSFHTYWANRSILSLFSVIYNWSFCTELSMCTIKGNLLIIPVFLKRQVVYDPTNSYEYNCWCENTAGLMEATRELRND